MSTSSPIPVLLLKTPTSPTDAYTSLFTSPSASSSYTYQPCHIPVLTHSHHLAPIFSLFDQPGSSAGFGAGSFPYGGLIFTSARAVDAFAHVIASLVEDHDSASAQLRSWQLPLYVVGPATADALCGTVLRYLSSCYLVGEEAGSGEALAPLIIRDYVARCNQGKQKKPLLFLVGEKHKDVVPRVLSAERLEVEEMIVYSTIERAIFRSELEVVLEETTDAEVRWLVVFSAAGTKAVLKALGWLDEATGKIKIDWDMKGRKSFVASIGPMTRDFLRKEFGFEVDVCAQKPSAEGVKEGIEEFMRDMSGKKG